MRKILPLFILIFILMSGAASANNDKRWFILAKTADNTEYFIDAKTVNVVSNQPSCWIKTVYSNPQVLNNKTYNYTIELWECSDSTLQYMRIIASKYYDNVGNIISSSDTPTNWERVSPNSVGESVAYALRITQEHVSKSKSIDSTSKKIQ